MLITRISGCKGKTFLLNRKDLDEIKYNFYKKVNGHSVKQKKNYIFATVTIYFSSHRG